MTAEMITDIRSIRKATIDGLRRLFPDATVDNLLCNPDNAKALCRDVRRQLSRPKLTDQQICRTLLNARKQGKIK